MIDGEYTPPAKEKKEDKKVVKKEKEVLSLSVFCSLRKLSRGVRTRMESKMLRTGKMEPEYKTMEEWEEIYKIAMN